MRNQKRKARLADERKKELDLAKRLCYEAQKRAFQAPDDERARRTYQNALLRLKDAEKGVV